MTNTVPAFVWPVVFGADLLLILLLVTALRRHGGRDARRLAFGAAAILTGWFVLAAVLSAVGAFVTTAGRPPTIGLGVLVPVLVGGAALALSRTVRNAVLGIPQHWIVAVQSIRALGVVFLVLLARGVLPSQFALPAGWGDVAVGVAAPVVALALARKAPLGRGLAFAWNVLGLVDLAVAVGVGALSAESSIRVFLDSPPTSAMAELPLAMIPVFGVPLFVLLHVVSLMGLASVARRSQVAVGTRAQPHHA